MAFDGLSSKLQDFTRKLRGKSRITESDLKEITKAFIETNFSNEELHIRRNNLIDNYNG